VCPARPCGAVVPHVEEDLELETLMGDGAVAAVGGGHPEVRMTDRLPGYDFVRAEGEMLKEPPVGAVRATSGPRQGTSLGTPRLQPTITT